MAPFPERSDLSRGQPHELPRVDLAMLGQAVRELREERGVTQEALAEGAGFPPTHVRRVELGEIDVGFSTFYALFWTLGVEQRELHDRLVDIDRRRS